MENHAKQHFYAHHTRTRDSTHLFTVITNDLIPIQDKEVKALAYTVVFPEEVHYLLTVLMFDSYL